MYWLKENQVDFHIAVKIIFVFSPIKIETLQGNIINN